MESKYGNREFEEYVKQNADQYRLFPSEKVWKNINNALHTRRKWYGAGLAILLLLTGTAVTLVMISYPVSKKQDIAAVKNTPEAKSAPVLAKQEIKPSLPFNGQVVINQSKPLFSDNASVKIAPVENNTSEITSFSPVEQFHAITEGREVSIINKTRSGFTNNTESVYAEVIDDQVAVKPIEQPSTIIADKKPNSEHSINYPLTIESVTNAYQPKKAGKLSWQFFITPTVSYRKLNTNESFDNSTAANYPFTNLSNINSVVTHKPDMGLQIGMLTRVPITKSLRLISGLQFNINRYDIKAFTYNPEVVSIRLNEPMGSSVWAWTNYRNYSGYKSNWLKNYYFSVSIPVGVEMKLFGNRKTNFGIASTIQPTYIIKDKAYLISTDYKNYAKVPSLVRHLNANAAFEAFVNYSNGKTRWQVGPQVRYQLLSSFQSTYPVKEHLFDFGLKMGVFINEK